MGTGAGGTEWKHIEKEYVCVCLCVCVKVYVYENERQKECVSQKGTVWYYCVTETV